MSGRNPPASVDYVSPDEGIARFAGQMQPRSTQHGFAYSRDLHFRELWSVRSHIACFFPTFFILPT